MAFGQWERQARVQMTGMKVEISAVERFPAASVYFEGEELFGVPPHGTVAEMSAQDAADLRSARDAWHVWESRLLAMLEPGSPPAGFFS
jgi:hypothetical protein